MCWEKSLQLILKKNMNIFVSYIFQEIWYDEGNGDSTCRKLSAEQ